MIRNNKGQFVSGVYVGFGFKVGHIPWNSGVSVSLSPKTQFKKGLIPWNKGKSRPYLDKSTGYMKISVDGREIKYHRYVMEKHLGRKLGIDELVHHINHDKLDNRIENLEIMSRGEHMRLHWELRRKNK